MQQVLIAISNARNVLEIGTSIGVSTLWICLGLLKTGGRITTIDYYPEHIRLAKENFKRAGVEDMVTIIEGDALNAIPLLNDKFDFVFSDANKKQNLIYFNLFMPLIANGGVIVAHDSITEADNMFDYLKTIKSHPQLDTVIISTANSPLGLAISHKKLSNGER